MPLPSVPQLPCAVSAALLFRHGKVLITLRPLEKRLGGYWEFPGGKIDNGESPIAALKRELREELAIDIAVGPLYQTVLHRYDWGSAMILAYPCQQRGGAITHLDVADHRWVKLHELLTYKLLPADRPIIDKLQREGLGSHATDCFV